jgi:hypothetical protein
MPNFNVNGLQYFGKLSLSSNGSTLVSVLTDIYNNTGTTFTGGFIGASPSTFPIFADTGFNFSYYSYSVTFTPINLVQTSQPTPLIPFYLSVIQVADNQLQVSMADYQLNEFAPNSTDAPIEYYINIRLETT